MFQIGVTFEVFQSRVGDSTLNQGKKLKLFYFGEISQACVIYFRAYLADPPSRGPGFGLTMLPTFILLLGGLGGAIWSAATT